MLRVSPQGNPQYCFKAPAPVAVRAQAQGLELGTCRISHRWSLIKQFSHRHTRTEAEAKRESHPQRQHVAAVSKTGYKGYLTSPQPAAYSFFPNFTFPSEFTCWAHWKILNLDPKTFPGFIFLQRWKQLGCRRWDGCWLNWPCWGLVARAAAGVTAINGMKETTGEGTEMQSDQRTPAFQLESKMSRVFAHLQAFLSPLFDAENPVSITHSPAIHRNLSHSTNILLQSPQRRQSGKGNMGKMSDRSCYVPWQ